MTGRTRKPKAVEFDLSGLYVGYGCGHPYMCDCIPTDWDVVVVGNREMANLREVKKLRDWLDRYVKWKEGLNG